MREGNIFTIEPMINMGVASLDHWKDDWTAVTRFVPASYPPSPSDRLAVSLARTNISILTHLVLCTSCRDGKRSAQFEETILFVHDRRISYPPSSRGPS